MPCGSKAAALFTAACPSARDAMVVCKGYSLALNGVKALLMTPMRPELLASAFTNSELLAFLSYD